jgi:hypothetical protein
VPDSTAGLDAAADELYAVLPSEFVGARDARARQARSSGAEKLAEQLKALRRPSAAAWLVNLLARSDPGLSPLTDLADQLRDAQTNLDASAMKAHGQERGRIVAELVERAVALGGEADPQFRASPAVREQVAATLTAAVADPAAEAAVTSGRLVSPLSYAGFGEVDLTDAVATPLHVVREKDERPVREPATSDDQPGVDQRAVARAEEDLQQAEDDLEAAEEAYAQARARRHQARLEVDRARRALEDLEEA